MLLKTRRFEESGYAPNLECLEMGHLNSLLFKRTGDSKTHGDPLLEEPLL